MSINAPSWTSPAPIIICTHDLDPMTAQLPTPTPEQVRATDGLFATESSETAAVLGLFSLTTGVAMLYDVARDALKERPIEEQDLRRARPKLVEV